MARIVACALFAMTALTANVAAQSRDTLPIDTDRPDFTDGVHTVARGRQQLEVGYTYQQSRGAGAAYIRSYPEALVRIGVFERAELRIGQNYLTEHSGSGAPGVSGFDDLNLGTKITLTDSHGLVPALAVEGNVSLPTGAAAIGAGKALPGAALLLGWDTDGPWSAGVEGYVSTTADDNGVGLGSLSVQYQLSDRWQLYGEVFAQRALSGPGSAQQYFNAGVHFFVNRNVQIDARIGAGLNQNADRYFTGFGFAIRR